MTAISITFSNTNGDVRQLVINPAHVMYARANSKGLVITMLPPSEALQVDIPDKTVADEVLEHVAIAISEWVTRAS